MNRSTALLCVLMPLATGASLACATASGQADHRPAPGPGARPATQASRSSTDPAKNEGQRRARMNYQLGVEQLQNGNAPQAIASLLEACRWDPTSERTELALSEAYRQEGRNQEAESHLLRSLEIAPGFHEGLLNLAALYIQTERYEEALVPLHRLLDDATFPGPWRALTNLGWAEYRLGKIDDAYQHLTLAIDQRPDYWPGHLDLGILEAERGNHSEAIVQFQRALEKQPGPSAEAEARYRLAEQLLAKGDRQGARRQLTTASRLEPSGPWSKRSAETLKSLD